MTHQLDTVFRELGISQYLQDFVEQGFDTWETILDITESDLDALGVKLGHRRKLQRRIANARGLAPDASLISPTQPSIEEARFEPLKPEIPRAEVQNAAPVISKRKYRRHPKPDENAPERPPSAYVLFSNKMREELRGRNLTFTEIAKLVGENWQSLSPIEKEPFESQAQSAKDKYNSDLGEYKKTNQYKKYNAYLQEFRAKHAHSDKDTSKRLKLSASGNGDYSGTSASGTPNRGSRSGSGSESLGEGEPPPSRQRVGSIYAGPEPLFSAAMTPGSQHASIDESINSPFVKHERRSVERSPSFSAGSPREMAPMHGHTRRSSRWENDRADQKGQRSLPPLADMFDGRDTHLSPPATEGSTFPFYRAQLSESPGPVPGLAPDGRPPILRTEQSSTGSTSSSLSSNFPRTPLEGSISSSTSSLPIHSLLTSKPSIYDSGQQLPAHPSGPVPAEHERAPYMPYPVKQFNPPAMTNGYHHPSPTAVPQQGQGPPGHQGSIAPQPHSASSAPNVTTPTPQGMKQEVKFDGMNALLRAGEIVDRRDIP